MDAPYLEAYTFNPMKQEVKYAEYLGPRYKYVDLLCAPPCSKYGFVCLWLIIVYSVMFAVVVTIS